MSDEYCAIYFNSSDVDTIFNVVEECMRQCNMGIAYVPLNASATNDGDKSLSVPTSDRPGKTVVVLAKGGGAEEDVGYEEYRDRLRTYPYVIAICSPCGFLGTIARNAHGIRVEFGIDNLGYEETQQAVACMFMMLGIFAELGIVDCFLVDYHNCGASLELDWDSFLYGEGTVVLSDEELRYGPDIIGVRPEFVPRIISYYPEIKKEHIGNITVLHYSDVARRKCPLAD